MKKVRLFIQLVSIGIALASGFMLIGRSGQVYAATVCETVQAWTCPPCWTFIVDGKCGSVPACYFVDHEQCHWEPDPTLPPTPPPPPPTPPPNQSTEPQFTPPPSPPDTTCNMNRGDNCSNNPACACPPGSQCSINSPFYCLIPSPTPTPSATPLACGAACNPNDSRSQCPTGCPCSLNPGQVDRLGNPVYTCKAPTPTPVPTPTPTPPACGGQCNRLNPNACLGAKDPSGNSCSDCRPNLAGVDVCQKTPQCGDPCDKTDASACSGVKTPAGADCSVCRDNVSGNPVCQPPVMCNAPCNLPADCAGAQNGCTMCAPDQQGVKRCIVPPNPTPTPVPTPSPTPPACGMGCNSDLDCNGSIDGCTVCQAAFFGFFKRCVTPPNPTPTPSPSAPACNSQCTTNFDCQGALNGCTQCLPDTNGVKRCVAVTPTPSPSNPACGVSCNRASDCAGARDGCTMCVPNGNGANQCAPNDFNASMCHCDGIEVDEITPGKEATFSAYVKVEGNDIRKATVQSVSFFLGEGDDTSAKILVQSGPVTPTVVEDTTGKKRFKAVWRVKIPSTLKKGATYRVWEQIACVPVGTASASPNASSQALGGNLLGVQTEVAQFSFFDSIRNFFARLFGRSSSNSSSQQATTSARPSATPAPSNKQISLGEIHFPVPSEILEKSCTQVKFKVL